MEIGVWSIVNNLWHYRQGIYQYPDLDLFISSSMLHKCQDSLSQLGVYTKDRRF